MPNDVAPDIDDPPQELNVPPQIDVESTSIAVPAKRPRDSDKQPYVEDNSIVHLQKPDDAYYHQFTDLVHVDHDEAVELFGRCYVRIKDQIVEAIVSGIYTESCDAELPALILCYMLYDKSNTFLGFFSSGRVFARNDGWELQDEAGINAHSRIGNDKPSCVQSLCVVLTGTFPELGGGSGVELGKAALTKLVQQTPGGRVVSALSGKTTHLVIGKDPGQVKIRNAQEKYSHVCRIECQDFLDLLAAMRHTVIICF
jgi:hypothetical protein